MGQARRGPGLCSEDAVQRWTSKPALPEAGRSGVDSRMQGQPKVVTARMTTNADSSFSPSMSTRAQESAQQSWGLPQRSSVGRGLRASAFALALLPGFVYSLGCDVFFRVFSTESGVPTPRTSPSACEKALSPPGSACLSRSPHCFLPSPELWVTPPKGRQDRGHSDSSGAGSGD